MSVQFICRGCRLLKDANYRLKDPQHYCRDPNCQRMRKQQWHNEKMTTDAPYRRKRLNSQSRWRKDHNANRYQEQYRHSHPRYVEKNRQQQQIRNHRRPKPVAADATPNHLIVKTDASTIIKSGRYLLTPYASRKIVKTDAYLVQLQILQSDEPSVFVSRR
jgi:hypothetical protein